VYKHCAKKACAPISYSPFRNGDFSPRRSKDNEIKAKISVQVGFVDKEKDTNAEALAPLYHCGGLVDRFEWGRLVHGLPWRRYVDAGPGCGVKIDSDSVWGGMLGCIRLFVIDKTWVHSSNRGPTFGVPYLQAAG
jgi:hypothetical protein